MRTNRDGSRFAYAWFYQSGSRFWLIGLQSEPLHGTRAAILTFDADNRLSKIDQIGMSESIFDAWEGQLLYAIDLPSDFPNREIDGLFIRVHSPSTSPATEALIK